MIELQTASAAGSAGYNRAGGIYVKAGDKTAGVVHAYTFFDTKGAINEALSAAGFSEKSGDELVDFLKNKSDTEVNAYFKMQQTALSLAFEKVAGKGSGVERETSRDERVIGRFGKWAGKQQDSSTANQLVTHGGPGAEAAKAQQAGDFLSFIALSGFGELGETGLRPSAVGPGFYVELELSNRFFGQEMARQQMKGMGTLDPASTFINQYNPVAMLAQATQNVRLATLSGKNEGYMWEAQALNMAKAPIVATGSALVIMGAPILAGGGPMAPVGGAIVAAGTAVMMAGNSINVNPTTGERIMKATDQSAVATAMGAITAFFGGAQIVSGYGGILMSGASALGQSSVRYDGEGRSQGMSLTSWKGDHHGERAVLNATTAMITSAGGQYAQRNAAVGTDSFMGNAIWGDLISTGTNVLSEYGAQQTWGRQHSNYDALTRPDSGRLGSLAGAIVTAQEQDRQAGEKLAALEAKQAAEIAQADKLAREGQKQQAIAILMAGGYFKDRRDAEAYVAKVKAQAEGLPEGELVKDAKGNFYVRDKDGYLHPVPKGSQSRRGVELAMPGFMSDSTEYIRAWAKTLERAAKAAHHELWDIPEENTGGLPTEKGAVRVGVDGYPVIEGPPSEPTKMPADVRSAVERVRGGTVTEGDRRILRAFYDTLVDEMLQYGGTNYFMNSIPREAQEIVTRKYFGQRHTITAESGIKWAGRGSGFARVQVNDSYDLGEFQTTIGLRTPEEYEALRKADLAKIDIFAADYLKGRSDFEIVDFFGREAVGENLTRGAQMLALAKAGIQLLKPSTWKAGWQIVKSVAGGKAAANVVKTANGYRFVLDKLGRVQTAEGTLRLNPENLRNLRMQKAAGGADRLATDQGGHYIARIFDGPMEDFNHFAQNGNFNQGVYRRLESRLAKALSAGKEVKIRITPTFDGPSLRPDKIEFTYTIDGIEDTELFLNVMGGGR